MWPGCHWLSLLGTLLAHIQSSINQYPQVPFLFTVIQTLIPKPIALHGVIVAKSHIHLCKMHALSSPVFILNFGHRASEPMLNELCFSEHQESNCSIQHFSCIWHSLYSVLIIHIMTLPLHRAELAAASGTLFHSCFFLNLFNFS